MLHRNVVDRLRKASLKLFSSLPGDPKNSHSLVHSANEPSGSSDELSCHSSHLPRIAGDSSLGLWKAALDKNWYGALRIYSSLPFQKQIDRKTLTFILNSSKRSWTHACRIIQHVHNVLHVEYEAEKLEMILAEIYRVDQGWRCNPKSVEIRCQTIKQIFNTIIRLRNDGKTQHLKGNTIKHAVTSLADWCDALQLFQNTILTATDVAPNHFFPAVRWIEHARNRGCQKSEGQIQALHSLLNQCCVRNRLLLRGDNACNLYERLVRSYARYGSWAEMLNVISKMDVDSTPSWRMLVPTAPTFFVTWALLVRHRLLVMARRVMEIYTKLYPNTRWSSITSAPDVSFAARMLMHTTAPLSASIRFEREPCSHRIISHQEKALYRRDNTWIHVKDFYRYHVERFKIESEAAHLRMHIFLNTNYSFSVLTRTAHLQFSVFFAAQPLLHEDCWRLALSAFVRGTPMESTKSIISDTTEFLAEQEKFSELCQRLAVLMTRYSSPFPKSIQRNFFLYLSRKSPLTSYAVAAVYARAASLSQAWEDALTYYYISLNRPLQFVRESDSAQRAVLPIHVLNSCLMHGQWSKACKVYGDTMHSLSKHVTLVSPAAEYIYTKETSTLNTKMMSSKLGSGITQEFMILLLRRRIHMLHLERSSLNQPSETGLPEIIVTLLQTHSKVNDLAKQLLEECIELERDESHRQKLSQCLSIFGTIAEYRAKNPKVTQSVNVHGAPNALDAKQPPKRYSNTTHSRNIQIQLTLT